MRFIPFLFLVSACSPPTPADQEQPLYGTCGNNGTPQKVLNIDIREFDKFGNEVPCSGDLVVMQGDAILTETSCLGLDATTLTYGTAQFQYALPDAVPRRYRVLSRSHRRLCPVEFTIQLAAQDGTCEPAFRFLSTQDCG